MKQFLKNAFWTAIAVLGLGVCAVGWNFDWLSDVGFIGVLAASLAVSLCAIQFLLFKLHQYGTAQNTLQREAAKLKSQVKLLLTQAHYDNLTGLGNRNLLNDRFQFVVERCMRSKASFALMMIDLNSFKSINDTYGHSAGDAVLIASANRLMASVRASDTVVRLGGDEFLLLIERFGKCNDVFKLGQKLIDTLSEEIVLPSGEIVAVGASVGIAQFPQDGVDMMGLIEYADQSMYECKTSGHMPLEFA
ncbi:MAG: GGDEF domain-containing protein [Rhodoferax sp.]